MNCEFGSAHHHLLLGWIPAAMNNIMASNDNNNVLIQLQNHQSWSGHHHFAWHMEARIYLEKILDGGLPSLSYTHSTHSHTGTLPTAISLVPPPQHSLEKILDGGLPSLSVSYTHSTYSHTGTLTTAISLVPPPQHSIADYLLYLFIACCCVACLLTAVAWLHSPVPLCNKWDTRQRHW